MLRCEGLRLRQGDFTLDADLAVGGAGVVAVVGPSGAGKSTLLAGIAGFLAPDAGRVTWEGRDLGPLAPGDRPLTVIFQDQNLFPHLTVFQNVGLGISPRLKLAAADRRRIDATLERVGLGGLADRRPSALSGGQASRAALARALVRERPLVLLDEPFAALGPALRREMLDLVRETLADRLVLMVSHDPEDARRIAARTAVVADGRAEGPFGTAALLDDPPPGLRAYLGDPSRE